MLEQVNSKVNTQKLSRYAALQSHQGQSSKPNPELTPTSHTPEKATSQTPDQRPPPPRQSCIPNPSVPSPPPPQPPKKKTKKNLRKKCKKRKLRSFPNSDTPGLFIDH